MTITYADYLANQDKNRALFGRMLLSWRRRNGWTQYTISEWAKETGLDVLSSGNLSVVERGKAGEVRQKFFWQLGEQNRRIAARDWGEISDEAARSKLENAIPLGDNSCPVWTALEFWACYCGLRPVPQQFLAIPAPVIGQAKAAELSAKWRRQMRETIVANDLDPLESIELLVAHARPHDKRFYAVLMGLNDYEPDELRELWVEGDVYRPDGWIKNWQNRFLPQRAEEAA